jgi:hypothetical protein
MNWKSVIPICTTASTTFLRRANAKKKAPANWSISAAALFSAPGTAEVALLQFCAYWKEYGMEVSYVPREILLEAVGRHEEFRSYGVRQLPTIF